MVGDTIEIRKDTHHRAGAELLVLDVESFTGDCVQVYDKRKGSTYFVHDSLYRIYEDIEYEHCGHKTITKRFLGIPIYKKTTEIIREVGAND